MGAARLWQVRRATSASLGPMSNPSLILICTLAASVCAWGPGFRGAGGGNDYATEQEGLTYGVQMEAWW